MELPPAPGSRSRAAGLTYAGVGLIVFGSLFWLVHPWYDPTNDGSMYIATARALVAGEGYSYLGTPFLIRPPGFSCLIAPLLALFGTSFLALNLAVSLSGALGVLLFLAFLRERLGLLLASLVALTVWFNPGYQRFSNQVMSDVPGWTCLLLCFLLERRERGRGPWGAVRLGVAVALSTYVRSGNLLFLPAVAGARLCALPWRERAAWRSWALESAALFLAGFLVLAPWSLRNRLVAPEPPADQTLLYDYSTGMFHEDMGDPRSPRVSLSEICARVPLQGARIVGTLGGRLYDLGGGDPWNRVIGWASIAALVVAAVRRRDPANFFALATLLVVSVYFGYAERLLIPVFALALAALVEITRDAVGRLGGARVGVAAAALGCATWGALDWHPRRDWKEIEGLHRAYAETARIVGQSLPADARLGAYRGWHHAVYLARPVYGFERALQREGSPAVVEQLIEKYGLDFVLLTPLGLPPAVQPAEREFARYVAQRYGGPDTGLVRVRQD